MAKGAVRKNRKKWYYCFYAEDAIGNLVQKECTGTESKSETEKLLRQAMEDYGSKKFIAKADNIMLEQLLDIWSFSAAEIIFCFRLLNIFLFPLIWYPPCGNPHF